MPCRCSSPAAPAQQLSFRSTLGSCQHFHRRPCLQQLRSTQHSLQVRQHSSLSRRSSHIAATWVAKHAMADPNDLLSTPGSAIAPGELHSPHHGWRNVTEWSDLSLSQVRSALSRARKEETVDKLVAGLEASVCVFGVRYKGVSVSAAALCLHHLCPRSL